MDKGIGPLIISLTPKNQPKPTPEQIKPTIRSALGQRPQGTRRPDPRRAGNKDLHITEKQIQDIRVPTLAIVGADDPLGSAWTN